MLLGTGRLPGRASIGSSHRGLEGYDRKSKSCDWIDNEDVLVPTI
jgi:hypothetical protein